MRRTSEKEVQGVLRLDGAARFTHFVKRVADSEVAWGLWKDGWALMEDGKGNKVFPLWPAREYAVLCCEGDWSEYEAREMALTDLLDELVPRLAEGGVLPGVFPTPKGKGVTVAPEELAAAIRKERQNYE
jgi:hypothetical protein